MADLENRILTLVAARTYSPQKPKALARRLGITETHYPAFRKILRDLIVAGRLEYGGNHTIRPVQPHGTVVGIFRRTASGSGFVRPKVINGKTGPEILIPEEDTFDAATGDEVLVKLMKKPSRPGPNPRGVVLRILERASRQFVGTYFERDGEGHVRVDGTIFSHSVMVGDPGAKGARPDDLVVIEMVRFPAPGDPGEAVITEILGPRGKPGVDTLAIIRTFGLPDEFPPEVLAEAREMAANFSENDLDGRTDFTTWNIITIDPVDARDFDDAISLTIDSKTGHWHLGVHIADVSHFAPPGSSLDKEARKRGTSVYLPQRVLPMFPEVISNGLASLQQDKVRYVKSALIEYSKTGQRIGVEFVNGAIRNRRRFTYAEVSKLLASEEPAAECGPEILALLHRMRDLALILRQRRKKRGSLELSMPATELEYDADGRVIGAHLAENDISHQMIEEFMLAANEAVAERLTEIDVAFLRRIHPAPEPTKLQAFADFARHLGYSINLAKDRFSLQRVLDQSANKPDRHAIHFALLRSLKQAIYSPQVEEHYALASQNYCHFTSPIRRYPDLTVHRLLNQWIRTKKAGSDPVELAALGEHCSRTERRAETAERELVKLKMLTLMSERIGWETGAIITGVAEYGFFAQADTYPVEGLVHVSSLMDDYYLFDEESHTLTGWRNKKRFRLGDRVRVQVARVDLSRRQLDFRIAPASS